MTRPQRRDALGPLVLPAQAVDGASADSPVAPVATSVATLLTRHVLRDGELVLLILKPSLLYIPLSSLKFLAGVVILLIAAHMLDDRLPYTTMGYVQLGILAASARLMWAVLQWAGRLYVLTDLRIVVISGVFSVGIFDCPLRKVARARLVRPTRERLLRLGTIEIIPQDENTSIGLWQTIARPVQVHEQIQATVRRARQGGSV
jgi:hypothetical protein